MYFNFYISHQVATHPVKFMFCLGLSGTPLDNTGFSKRYGTGKCSGCQDYIFYHGIMDEMQLESQ